MTLGERIKTCRKATGLSQEQVAEKVGVSRQAVTKWETDLSAPSTENLFKLAEIFGTTVDLLESEKPDAKPGHKYTGPAAAIYDGLMLLADRIDRHYLSASEEALAARKARRRKRLVPCLLVLCFYLAFYLMGRYLWCRSGNVSILGFLFSARPAGTHSYLYGWLLSSKLFYGSAILSLLPALFKKPLWFYTACGGHLLGFVLGLIFGPYPKGAAIGHSDYGWAIWAVTFLVGFAAGFILDKVFQKRQKA